jgi:hypothetical protein
MSHASQQCSRWGDDWKEKGTRIIVPKIPSQDFSIIYRDRCLVTGKRRDLTSRHVVHESPFLLTCRSTSQSQTVEVPGAITGDMTPESAEADMITVPLLLIYFPPLRRNICPNAAGALP